MNKRQKLVQTQFLTNEKAVINRLEQVYGKSLIDINALIKKKEDEILGIKGVLAELDELEAKIGKGSSFAGVRVASGRLIKDPYSKKQYTIDELREIYKSQLQSKIYQKSYQKGLQKQVSGIYDKLLTSGFATISEYLDECYTDGFIGTIFDAHGQGVPIIAPIDQKAMVRAVQLDSKISKGLYTRLGEDVDLLKKKITAQVSRSIATGMTYSQTAKALEGYTRIGYNNAIRIARTEGHRIQTTATMDAMEQAKAKGADVLKQWDSTLDSRTRESHALVDGEIREMDESFSNGLMYPGDPDGEAAEVINCRCALLQRARWALDADELKTLQDKAKYFGLDKSDEFEDFKKKYLKAVETPDVVVPKYMPNYNCELATKFGKDYYDELHQRLVDCPDSLVSDVFKKYEADIQVGDANYRGHAHASGSKIYVNGTIDAKGSNWEKPYAVTFHESGHAIDSVTKKQSTSTFWGSRHFSSAYKDGLFPQTIKDEVQELVKVAGEGIKKAFKEHAGDKQWFIDNGYMYSWQTTIPKYSKSMAYGAVEKMIKSAGDGMARADLSDMLEGATVGKIQCGYGHGKKYWQDRTYDGLADGLATEAFAEMTSATITNPESLAMIKKYLPKSYSVYQDMLKDLL